VDSPDRHSADELTWLPRLQELAYDAGRPLAVVAAVSAVPASWDGPVAVIGNAAPAEAAPEPAPEAPAGRHSAETIPAPQDQETKPETEVAK
jgi:hypothetical protein